MEALAAALLVFGASGLLGWYIGRLRGRWWLLGYAVSMAIVVVLNVSRYVPSTLNTAAGQWLTGGRHDLWLIGIATIVGIVPCMHKVRPLRTRVLLGVFMAVLMLRSSVLPLVGPLLDRAEIANLPTVFDENDVCLQTTNYTCGPASLVTALRALGIEETESNAALETLCNSYSGTRSGDIVEYVNRAYGALGVRASYLYVPTVDELRALGGVAIAEVKSNFWMDHFVAIVAWDGTSPIIADPFCGRFKTSRESFARTWRNKAIVIQRDEAWAALPGPSGPVSRVEPAGAVRRAVLADSRTIQRP
jgi:predicted double-glycine peptidase